MTSEPSHTNSRLGSRPGHYSGKCPVHRKLMSRLARSLECSVALISDYWRDGGERMARRSVGSLFRWVEGESKECNALMSEATRDGGRVKAVVCHPKRLVHGARESSASGRSTVQRKKAMNKNARMVVAHPAGRFRFGPLVLLLDPSVASTALANIRANVDDRTLSEPICDRPP